MWTFTPNALADGVHTIVASETDAAGNTALGSPDPVNAILSVDDEPVS
jgi:Bacterial Ig-like domain